MINMHRFFVKIRQITNLKDYIDVQSTMESLKKGIDFRGPNVWILAFAIIVASVGLNVNSIPVIIGAMLISPLMGPIMGIGMSVAINDTMLLQRAMKNLAVMVGISLLASFAYFLISPLQMGEPTELLARTRPTIFDVFIALFGGLAGIVESARKEKGTVIAGVAIATALMPPLCTAGYGLANAEWGYFIGAFYLFLINSFFIALATFIMSRFMKFPVVTFTDKNKQRRVNRTIAIFSAITVLPSIVVAWMVVKENSFDRAVDKFVKEHATAFEYTEFVRNDIEKTYHAFDSCELVIPIIGQPLSDFQISLMRKRMEEIGLQKTQLKITRSLAFANASENETAVAVIKSVYEHSETALKNKDERIAQLEKELSTLKSDDIPYTQIAREIAVTYPSIKRITLSQGARISVDKQEAAEVILVVVYGWNAASRNEIKHLEEWLKVRLNRQNIQVITSNE